MPRNSTLGFDPLSRIPSTDALRERLGEITEYARRLRILLQTAEQLEASRSPDAQPVAASKEPKAGGQNDA